MDRQIVVPGALPQDTDILNTNMFAMIGQAYLNAAVIGSATAVAGLGCTPTSPASLVVNVGVGSIYAVDEIDASAYGSLGTNTSTVVKQGILSTAVALPITPPGTAGYSQNYLVQVALQDVDSGAQVLSFYNSSNPAQPFSGPNNSGASSMTVRQCNCTIALKAGTPATTGTQATPVPDAGFIGLYSITVANGASQISQNNISKLGSAPFFPTLPQVPYQVQQGTYVYAGQDTGLANAYVITFAPGQPIPSAYTAGMKVSFKALNACTGASTINVNGLGNVSIRRASGVALSTGDIVSGGVVELTYDGTYFQMANYLGAGATSNTTTAVNIPYVVDTGSANAIVATYSPAITSGQQVAGLTIEVKLANTITGACTINVNGLGAKNIVTGDIANPPNGVYVAGEVLLLIYDGTQYQIANSTSLVYRKPSSNVTIYVNASLGSDTLYDGTSASISGSRGPFATISKAIAAAWQYAPSSFTITISVAAGTYTENPVSPSWPTSPVTITGAGVGSTVLMPANAGAYAMTFMGPNNVTLQNFTISGVCVAGVLSTQVCTTNIQNMVFAGTYGPGQHIWTTGSGTINITGAITVTGSCNIVMFSEQGGNINFGPSVPITIGASISVTSGFAGAAVGGYLTVNTPSPPAFTNPSFVNGPKYTAQSNGVIYAAGQGYNFFPGSIAGSQAAGGQYIP